MKKITTSFLLVILSICSIAQENDLCQSSSPVCANTIYGFQASTGGYAQGGPFYGCLLSQPNPSWFYFKIATPGDLIITLSSQPENDIDFICWGPFDDPQNCCSGGLTTDRVVSCSYSSASSETCIVNTAGKGEYYVLLITNFSNNKCSIVVKQTGGDGTTDCTILPAAISCNSPVCESDTLKLLADLVEGATYNWQGPGSFASTQQNPVVPNPSPSMSGEYRCIISTSLQSDTASLLAVIHETPTAHLNGDAAVCKGNQASLEIILSGTPPWTLRYTGVDMTTHETIYYNVTAFTSPLTIDVSPENSSLFALQHVEDSFCTGICSGHAMVTVFPLPVAAFDNTTALHGTATSFHDKSFIETGEIIGWDWDFGDGQGSSVNRNPDYYYSEAGTYLIQLTVTSSIGCTDNVQHTLVVYPALTSTVAGIPEYPICKGESVSLNASASGGSQQYQFTWKDETGRIISSNPEVILTPEKTSGWILEVDDGYSSVVEYVEVMVYARPPINLIPNGYQSSAGDSLKVCTYDQIVIHAGDPGMIYRWFDGSAGPDFTLNTTGVGIDMQTIWLEVTDPQTGCIYSDTLTIVYDFTACVGFEDDGEDPMIRFFPNPTQDILFGEYVNIRGPIQLMLTSMTGQIVLQQTLYNDFPGMNQIQLDLQFLPKGMYLLKFIYGQQCRIEKILVN